MSNDQRIKEINVNDRELLGKVLDEFKNAERIEIEELTDGTLRMKAIRKDKQYCACGCGNEVIQKTIYQYIRYLPGHNNKPVIKRNDVL